MIRNIIWNLNGTLFDTYPAITYAFSKTLNEMGYSVALNVIDGLVRQSFAQCVQSLSKRFNLDPDLFCQKFTESYLTISPAKQPPFDGAMDVCALIRRNGGVNIAVTHRTVLSSQKLLAAHNMSDLVDDIISTTQGYSDNPNPAVIIVAMEKHSLNPPETLLVSDRELDIQAGKSAGIGTCLFGSAIVSEPADILIDNYDQLLEILTLSG